MTTDELLKLLAGRGLRVVRDAAGKLALRGDRAAATDRLMKALGFHRTELEKLFPTKLEELGQPKEKQYLWRFGQTATLPASGPPPVGAWWFRYVGETEWRPVPGTPGEQQRPAA